MKTAFENLKKKSEDLTVNELQNEVMEFVNEVVKTDEGLLSVSKKWVGYGTWKTSGFANKFHFGEELSDMLVKSLSGKVVHDEDKEFTAADFEQEIFDVIFESI